MDIGESSHLPVYMLFLDWAQAFDSVTHVSLLHTLRRMRVPEALVLAIARLYNQPEFRVEVCGASSE
eukprot:9564904-Prorocentrum_lima.AAC.1